MQLFENARLNIIYTACEVILEDSIPNKSTEQNGFEYIIVHFFHGNVLKINE